MFVNLSVLSTLLLSANEMDTISKTCTSKITTGKHTGTVTKKAGMASRRKKVHVPRKSHVGQQALSAKRNAF